MEPQKKTMSTHDAHVVPSTVLVLALLVLDVISGADITLEAEIDKGVVAGRREVQGGHPNRCLHLFLAHGQDAAEASIAAVSAVTTHYCVLVGEGICRRLETVFTE